MAKPWFKIHTEKWLTGSTRRELTDAERGRWVDCLALCARHNIDGRTMKQDGLIPMTTREIAWTLHLDPKTVQKDFQKLQKLGMIIKDPDGYRVQNWRKFNPTRDDIYRHKQTHSDTLRHNIQNLTESESESESESENRESVANKVNTINRVQEKYPYFDELDFDACAEWCSDYNQKHPQANRVPNLRTCLNWAKRDAEKHQDEPPSEELRTI